MAEPFTPKKAQDIINVIGAQIGKAYQLPTVPLDIPEPKFEYPKKVSEISTVPIEELKQERDKWWKVAELLARIKVVPRYLTWPVEKKLLKMGIPVKWPYIEDYWRYLSRARAYDVAYRYASLGVPVTRELLNELERSLQTEMKKVGEYKKRSGLRSKKDEVYLRLPTGEAQTALQQILEDPKLQAATQRLLGQRAEEAYRTMLQKMRAETIDVEKLRLPEVAGHYMRGQTLAERTREEARQYSERIQQALTDVTNELNRVLQTIASPEASKMFVASLYAPIADEVAREWARLAAESGRTWGISAPLDVSAIRAELANLVNKSQEFITNASNVFKELLGAEVDLLSELKQGLGLPEPRISGEEFERLRKEELERLRKIKLSTKPKDMIDILHIMRLY